MNDTEKKLLMERWKFFEQAAHGEKSWMHERLSWLLVPQGVLFAALAWIVKLDTEKPGMTIVIELLTLVPFLGFLLSVAGLIGVVAAGRMHYIWTSQLNVLAGRLNKNNLVVPFGTKPHWPARSSSVIPSFIAILFTCAWLFLVLRTGKLNGTLILGIVIILALLGFIGLITHRAENRGRKRTKAIVFDADGVLLDTLAPHLKFCSDFNREFKLNLKIPDEEDFKLDFVRKGYRISPMKYFFRAIGFEGEFLDKANERYRTRFSSDYELSQFDGVREVLDQLSKKGIPIGIVTSNNQNNIEKALTGSFHHFREDCIFTYDNNLSKEKALIQIANNLGLKTKELLYVGDQFSDYNASQMAGSQFLGVSYGWGISISDTKFDVVRNLEKLLEYTLSISEA